ncbi:MAG: hypothetical protein PHQ75_13470 [Thermoguttaceae bacterium]|nr:hypothetical protein [Thermoguttaceae bacterium]
MLRILTVSIILTFLGAASICQAAFPFFQGGKRIEANEQQEYYLKDSDGLWFVLAKTYMGDDAREKANKLVHELRKRYKMPAYIYKLDPDTTELEELSRQHKTQRRYKYQTVRAVEYAVLVGSFPSSEDLGLQKTLLSIKRSQPTCLSKDPMTDVLTEKFAALAKKNKEFAGFGPLGGAIAVPNPMIPKEYYSQKGIVDSFVEKINSDSSYNLLNNKKMYTLRVATFTGDAAFQKATDADKNLISRLEMAGIKADALCRALRKKGVEAWEFHDRDSSFVTIGSFDNYGQIRPDGRTEIDPKINELIEKYRGQMTKTSTGAYRAYTVVVDIPDPEGGLKKKKRLEIPFDLQPVLIVVPQRPENIKKTLQAQQKIKAEQRQYEKQRAEETILAGDEEHSRHYALVKEARKQQAKFNAETVSSPEITPEQLQGATQIQGATQTVANNPQQGTPVATMPNAAQPYAAQMTPQQQIPGQPYAAQMTPQQQIPGQPYAAQMTPQQQIPGQPYAAQMTPQQQIPGQPYAAQMTPQQQVPVSQFGQQQLPGFPPTDQANIPQQQSASRPATGSAFGTGTSAYATPQQRAPEQTARQNSVPTY